MSNTDNPCYQCPDRWVKRIDGNMATCHSTCERHKTYINRKREEKAKLIEGRNAYNKEYRDRLDKIDRLKKHHWRKTK